MDKITLVVGSTRTGSFNQQLADVVRETVGDRAAVAQLDYTDVPFMNQDIEWPTPDAVARVRGELAATDGIWIVTPEYNGLMPALVKNLLDWMSRPMLEGSAVTAVAGKPVVMSGAGGRQAAEQYVLSQDPPTAMFCVNDVSAIGLMDTLKKLQPDRPLPAVMGIGDISAAVDQQPSLTTAQLPLAEMGNIAARTLLDRMTGKHAISMKIELPYKLIHRQSTPDL